MHQAQPIASHIERSLDDTRAQVVEHLVAKGVRITNCLEQRVEQLLLTNQQKLDAHMLEFSAQQQDRLSSFTQGAISEVQLQVNCCRSEKDQIQQFHAHSQRDAQKVSALDQQVTGLLQEVQELRHFFAQEIELLQNKSDQQLLKLEQRFWQALQGQNSLIKQLHQQLVRAEAAQVQLQQNLLHRIAGGEQTAEKGLHEIEGRLQNFNLGLQNCASQTQALQGAVQTVEKGIQSALGQVSTQLQSQQFNTTRVSDKLFQVERNLEKAQAAAIVPAPVVVPVTVNLEPIARQVLEPAAPKQPSSRSVVAEIGFELEPLEEEVTALGAVSLFSPTVGSRDPTYAVRPVSTGAAGSSGASRQQPVCVVGDLVASQMARSLTPPHFDERNPDWHNFKLDWETYWEGLSLGKHYSEAQKLQIFEDCLCDSLRQYIRFQRLSGAKPGFTHIFASLQARFAPENDLDARKAWYDIHLKTPGKTTRADWGEFWVKFSTARLAVKNSSDEETIRLLLSRVPEFISKWITEEQCKKTQKHPRVKLSAKPGLTNQGVSNTIHTLIGVVPRAVTTITDGEYMVEFESRAAVEKMFVLQGRKIQGHHNPLQVQVMEWILTPEDINILIDDKLTVRDRQDKVLGMSDRVPKYTKNTRFSSKVQAIGQENDEDEDPAQIAVTKREPAKKTPSPVQKQVVQGPNPSQQVSAAPVITQPPTMPQSDQQPSVQRPACFHCGVPGHFMRECQLLMSTFPGKGNAGKGVKGWKGGLGKGFDGKGFSQNGKGKGKGPSTFSQPAAISNSPNVSSSSVATSSTSTQASL